MRILITGGKGQLGQALRHALTADEAHGLGHANLDITDEIALHRTLSELHPDVVIHAAAWTDTAGCERDPAHATQVNGVASGFVAKACHEAGAAMVYVSSNEIFDGEKRSPYVEEDEPNPINKYGHSKLEGERRVRSALERFYIVRTSWLYGPGRVSFPEKIVQTAREKGSLKLVTDEMASPTWTVDLATAIARLIRKPAYGVYHLTNSGDCSRMEWAKEILRLAGLRDILVQPATQADFGAPFRKPVFSALANVTAAGLGIEMRPWQEALADHFRGASHDPNVVMPVRSKIGP
jgi:dTDP-4-dehydrorhamnose reductase